MDSIRRWFFRQIAYPAAVGVRGEHSVFRRHERLRLLESQSNGDRVAKEQEKSLARVLSLAAEVPHYADHKAPSAVDEAAAAEVLASMPVLEKAVVQSEGRRLTNPNWKGRIVRKTTGGSTGRPVTILKSPGALAQEMAATWLGYGWFGIRMGDPCVRFWGRPVGNWRRRVRYFAADMAMHRLTLSAFGYDRDTLRSYLRTIRRFRPRYLYGYVSALEDLARAAVEEGFSLPQLVAVVTTSEVLTPPQREAIRAGFHVPVQNEYGCGEVGPIAYQCPNGSLHLLPTNHFVEIVRPDGSPAPAGEIGAVLITDLTNPVMPLIRYRVGDNAAFGKSCSCSRPFPTLLNVFGREYDFVVGSDGRRFHGEFFMYVFEDIRKSLPDLLKFQVIQTAPDRIVIKVVASGAQDSRYALSRLEREFKKRLPRFSIQLERVDDLNRLPSGKTRVVENRMTPNRS